MKTLRNFALLILLVSGLGLAAQNPGGTTFFIDYDEFQVDGFLRYVNCGDNAALNTGADITIEAWVKIFDTGWNQKIIGKTNASFNSGYVMGIWNGKCYSEIWNPVLNEMQEGFVLPQEYWVHFAVTFTAGGMMTTYVNGINEGSQPVSSNPIGTNTDPLIIGIAPWDMANFQTFGEIDEVRIWNTVRTESEINMYMYRPLSGSETGLVAYYQFDEGSGTSVSDSGPNGINGTIANGSDNNWLPSTMPMASTETAATNDLAALWRGVGLADPRVASTDQGLSLLGNFEDGNNNYSTFGHDGGSGKGTADIGSDAPSGFERANRQWHMTTVSTVVADVVFDLTNASGGTDALPDNKDTDYYTLLWRADASSDYVPVANAAVKAGGIITFEDFNLGNGWYTIGVGDAVYQTVSTGLQDLSAEINAYPNPASDALQLNWTNGVPFEGAIYSLDGKLVSSFSGQSSATINVSKLPAGTYTLELYSTDRSSYGSTAIQVK